MVITATGSLFEVTEDMMDISMAYYRYHGN